jgi:hypothetical protein
VVLQICGGTNYLNYSGYHSPHSSKTEVSSQEFLVARATARLAEVEIEKKLFF